MLVRLLAFVVLPCSIVSASELARLSPQTWQEFAPVGKEVDCIYGDYVLRNDRLVCVIADPIPTRHANMTVREVGGAIIDLTRRHGQSDQLSAYYPEGRRFPFTLKEFGVGGQKHTPQANETIRLHGRDVFLSVSSPGANDKPAVEVYYSLADNWDFIMIHTVYENTGNAPIEVDVLDSLRADKGFTFAKPGQADWFWFSDTYWRQAYAVRGVGRQIQTSGENTPRTGSVLRFAAEGSNRVSLKPGQSFEWSRHVFAGANLFEVKAFAARSRDEELKTVVVETEGSSQAFVKLSREGVVYGEGYTNGVGLLRLDVPPGKYDLEVSAIGNNAKQLEVDTAKETIYRVRLEMPGVVDALIRGEDGGRIACKVQFIGVEPTKDPDFGPDTAEHEVKNLYYSHNGMFRQDIAPGKYKAIISHGPEYDAVFTEINVTGGLDTPLRATLVRSVQTPGWVSADFHNHSSPSGDNTSSQFGRVLNLLCEHVEFAPCTEHNRIDSYMPHLELLGATHLMATCTGIELTGQPLPLNHQNAFPLIHKPRTQDGGGPVTDADVELQISRLALWDNRSEKLVQQNHPDLGNLFFDKNGDGVPDEGFKDAFPHMDVMEVHPLDRIFDAAEYKVRYQNADQVRNNTILNWMQLLNQGYRIPGVVNTDAHYNFHGSGFIRNYIKSSTDDPARIQTLEMVRSSEKGNVTMTTGPYLEVSLVGDKDRTAIPGENLAVTSGKATLRVRVQCPNWFDIDRVQVFLNGRPAESLNFTRENTPEKFTSHVVKFQQELPISFEQDTHVIVTALGEKSTLGTVMGPEYGKLIPIAVSNPIFVDVDGNGFRANGDTLGAPLPVKAGARPMAK